MKRTSRIIISVLALTAVAVTTSLVLRSVPVRADWSDWDYYAQLEVRNNATVPLPSGYTVSLVLDTAGLISQGRMQANCADLRISYGDGVTESEMDRLVEGCNTSLTAVTFRTQAEVGVGGTDVDYRLYYGNAASTDPPEDPNNVYAFFDDFEDGDAAGWSGAKGTWSVVDDGGNYVYRYTGGGANWAISYVNLPSVSDLEYVAKIRATDSPFTNWIGLAFRIQDENNFLTFYESRDTTPSLFKFARIVSDNHTIPEQPAFTMPPDVWYWLRLQAIGNQVRARIWADGSAEPTGWNIERTESTFQSETNIGATLYNHTTEADWDDVQVRNLVDSEPTVTLHWESAPWWDNAWGYRIRLTVANNSSADTLPVGYSVPVMLDTSALIGAGQILNNCDDLRLVSFDGATNTETDRVVEDCDTDHTDVWFALQRTIGHGGEDDNYYLYYGNPSAGAPPADGMSVFIFYEDWEQGTDHWTGAGGLDPGDTGTMGTSEISDEEWVSPSHGQKFPQKAGGGDAFSGYIPVIPSTGYAIGVWGKSGENTYAPVGFDPYDASYNQGSEVWLWTSEWTIGPEWSYRSARFTTPANAAYVKIKSEWWDQGPGTEPVYLDDLVLRYALADEPTVTPGEEETILPVPVITDIEDTGPVEVGTPITVTAVVSSTEGTIDTVTLRVLSPETADVGMSLIAGDVLSGTWQGDFTPSEGGLYTYRILATSSVGRSKLSAAQTFTASDTLPPEITLVSITDPIEVKNTQTLTVTVADNGRVDQVTVEVEGNAHPMTQHGDDYDYSWRVMSVGTITYTVTATDTVGNSANLVGSFESLAREVDVCTWWDCKSGAASWSIDDGHDDCRSNLEAAGFRGTYYYNGSSTLSWFAIYSAAGHEIGSHTVSHPCDTPCCSPNCTPEAIWECPYTEAEVNAYRQSQLEPNIAAIEAGTGMPVVSMAWPCGCADARRMTAASYYLLGARGYYDYIAELHWVQDVNEATPAEFMNLNSANSYNQTFIDRAIAEGKWAIITSHGSCTGIDYIGSRSDVLWAAPVGKVLEYIYIRDAADFTNYSRFGQTISFDVAHNLGEFQRQQVDGTPMSTIVFTNPVTLKVHILDTDDVLDVEVDGTPVSYTVQALEGTRYVLFDASLEATRHVTVTLAQPAPTIEQVSDNSPVEFGAAAHVTATVTIEEGTVQTVTLRVLSPEAADYPMSLTTGTTDTYAAGFVPGQLANYSYRVLASNDEGNTAQSALQTLVVQDTTPPSWRAQSQAHDTILVSEPNTLTAEGFDIGGLEWAILATDESGTWQEFTWPVTDWWDHDWAHRRPVTVTETAGLTRTAETVDLFISEDEFPGLTSCAAELRVADENRNEVPVQVYDEGTDGGTLTCHLLFQASLDANASRTYYVYYGNPSATPPSYTTDLTSSAAGDLLTVHNNFFDLDLDSDGGVVSRIRLLGGSNTNLPLAPESDFYWGWHQVCSSADGNITGKDQLCTGGGAPATGLTLTTTLDGPIVKEFTFTSVKDTATYTMSFRFVANTPYYQYTLIRTGTGASVMNNFWYSDGNFARFGIGSGGSPSTVYNTYGYGADQARIASFASVDYASIDGMNNDGTDLGGTDYQHPTASGLVLYVTTGATQEATQGVLGRLAAPVALELAAVEEAPEGQYGSPMDVGGATAWTSTGFTWQNSAIPAGTAIQWRVKYCDVAENCGTTDVMSFTVQSGTVDDEPPQYSDPSTDSTTAGQPVEFSLRWTDNVGLDGYIFSFDNGTGTFVDDAFVEFTEGSSGGPWWNSEWSYRREITIDNTASPEALTDYAVLITVDTASPISAGKMNEHGGDIRFIDGEEELDFWVESGINTASTRIWVKVPNIPASSTKQVCMYYGNPNRRVPQSDGDKTFPVFDNFGGRGWEEFKYSGNPVMGPGSPAGGSGTFASVMRESETLWRMYASYDSDGSDIGLSTSSDGINWTHQGVVLRKGTAGEWDSDNIWCPAAWKEDGTYYMLYVATGPVGMQMGLATSPDGDNWTKYAGNPIFNDPDWASGNTEAPCFSALKEGDTYYVMYNTLGGHRQSSIASSTNLTDWTRVYDYPRFPGGPSTSSWNYNTFCGNVFKYEDMFYLVLPGQDSSRNYAKYGLYVSHSPAFPEDDTEFKGIVVVGNPTGWEDEDMDTPWAVQFDGKMHLYYAACGSCWSQTGVAIIDDIPLALAQAYPPGNYINVNRDATASQRIMPPVGWEKSVAGYLEVNSQNFEVTLDPAVTGRAIVQHDGNSTDPLELYQDVASLDKGVVSAWMRASNTGTGDYDLYVYGDSQSTLALVVGLGGNGFFHYWNGSFVDTEVTYSADTWYLVQVEFDSSTDKYNLAVYDTAFTELLRVDEIDFGAAISAGIDRINFRTSGTFDGNAHVDDVFVRKSAPTEPDLAVGLESTQVFTDAWSRVTKVVNSTPGTTIRWRFSANDTSDNWSTSDIYSFVTTVEDTPPTVTLNSPEDDHWAETSSIDFSATCSDEYDIAQVSLYGDWSGSWALIDTVSGPGLNGTEVVFSETVPDGSWTWNVECYDDTGNSNWGISRTINVDSEPDPWWHCSYDYRRRLIVHENSGHDLTDYPVYAIADTAALIAAGKMQPDCDDARVTHDGTEIPGQVMDCNTENTKIWLQTDLLASESKLGFYLYYGSPTATATDYSSQSSITWDNPTLTMDTGKVTGTFDPDGGIISQIKNNANSQDLMINDVERGLGYLFSDNPSVYYIFRVDESDDTVALTVDGPIVKVVTAYSGEFPQWVQENVFYNNQDFIDFKAYRPAAASTEKFLTGANLISPDGVFSTAETNELLRVDNSPTDISVVFDEVWRFDPTNNRGYVGLVDPDFTNELAFVWDESYTADFTWKPRLNAPRAGTYSLFIGGDGTTGTYGTIDADTFDYRFVLRYSSSPSNDDTQPIYDYYVTDPPTVDFGPEETPAADTTPPTVTITSPTNTSYEVDTIPLTFSVSEAVQWCGYSLNGGDIVNIEDCGDTVLTSLSDGPYELTVYADDCAGNRGSSTVNFTVEIVPFAWWDTSWYYRVPITVDTGDYSRTNEPIEHVKNFTQEWVELGITGLTFDINSIRVVEYSAAGDLIGEVPSQFDPAPDYDAATNAVGTIVWIMYGTTDAHTTRHYYAYFDSTDNPKPAPDYSTDLDWDSGTRTLSNTYIDATIGTVLDAGKYRTGINTLEYSSVEYTDSSVAGGAGIYYLTSETAGAGTYEALSDGPVKKTIKITPAANGEASFTLYDQSEFIRAEGTVTGSGFGFTVFPYAHALKTSVLSNQLHYYNAGGIVDESVSSQGWLSDAPDEGWVCLDGLGDDKDLCLVTDDTTLASSTDFWRFSSASRQLIFPAWNPNPTFPIEPVSWIVMVDTYQDGRDFWNKLSSPVIETQGSPETLPPESVEVALNSGWNLVSFNLHPVSTVITDVLSSINGNFDLVYAWDAPSQQWRLYDVSAPPLVNTLTDLDRTLGFWIHVTITDTLEVVGSAPTTTDIDLFSTDAGWNLVGYPSAVNRDLPGVLQDHGVGEDFSFVYAYHANDSANPWKLFDRTAPGWSNDLTYLSPGWGYWVKVGVNDHTWDVAYQAP